MHAGGACSPSGPSLLSPPRETGKRLDLTMKELVVLSDTRSQHDESLLRD